MFTENQEGKDVEEVVAEMTMTINRLMRRAVVKNELTHCHLDFRTRSARKWNKKKEAKVKEIHTNRVMKMTSTRII